MIPNSLTAHIYHENIVLCGGSNGDRLWYLNTSTFQWHEELCTGVFPPPTQFSASTICGSCLYLCGGEILSPNSLHDEQKYPHVYHEELELFVLDLITLEWRIVPCQWKPRSRSHHTLTTIDNALLLLGGKPQNEEVTPQQVRELMLTDFYTVHLFDIASGVWRLFSHAPFPSLWGHSVHVINDDAVVIYGGFETTLAMDENNKEFPAVSMNTFLRFLNTRTMKCYRAESRVSGRVFHQSHICCGELYILGGFSVHEAQLSLVPQQDAMKISLTTFKSSPVSFCLQHWPLDLVVSAVYKDELIVLKNVDDIFVLNGSESVWNRIRCDTKALTSPPLMPIHHPGGETEKTAITQSPLDLPPSKPSVSPILLTMLQRLGYPL